MSHAVTFDDVWRMFQETAAQMKESDRQMREMSAETDRQMREMSAETDRQIREMSAAADREFQEIRQQMRETDLRIKAVSRQIGQLGGRLGEFVEEMIKPSCLAMFQRRGIPVDEVYGRASKKIAGETMEIDLLLANTVAAVLIEIKSHLTTEDVRTHLKRLSRFKEFFPRYADCRVYGAVAGMVIASEADRFAMNQGLFVIAQTGESVQIANSLDFVPVSW
ncbi:MAG: hypothetical protein HQL78_07205 [Magnetococcales bacterium]|nr:hypothetical protein [Magnetococcales bacterium]